MSFGFVPPSAVGEVAAQAEAEERVRPRLHRPEGLTVFAVRSHGRRGHLLVSHGMVSFHPRRGPEVVHMGPAIQLSESALRLQVQLDDGSQRLTVSLPRWERRRLRQTLQGAGLDVT